MAEDRFTTEGFITGNYPAASLDGFNPIGDIDEQAQEQNARLMAEAEEKTLANFSRITACFRSAEGRDFLEWLRFMTIEQPAFFPQDYPLGQAGHVVQLPADQQGFVREGQNTIYREIIRMMDTVEAGPSEQAQAFADQKGS